MQKILKFKVLAILLVLSMLFAFSVATADTENGGDFAVYGDQGSANNDAAGDDSTDAAGDDAANDEADGTEDDSAAGEGAAEEGTEDDATAGDDATEEGTEEEANNDEDANNEEDAADAGENNGAPAGGSGGGATAPQGAQLTQDPNLGSLTVMDSFNRGSSFTLLNAEGEVAQIQGNGGKLVFNNIMPGEYAIMELTGDNFEIIYFASVEAGMNTTINTIDIQSLRHY